MKRLTAKLLPLLKHPDLAEWIAAGVACWAISWWSIPSALLVGSIAVIVSRNVR